MTSRLRILASAPMWTAIALFAVVSESWGLAAMAALAVVVGVAYGPRWDAARSAQLLFGVVLIVGVYAAQSALDDPDRVGSPPLAAPLEGVALATLLYAALRLAFARPVGGPRVTYALVLVAVIACGPTPHRDVYVVAIVITLLTTLWSLRGLDPARPEWGELSTKSRVVSFALPASAAAFAVAAAWPLVPIQQYLQEQLNQAVAARYTTRTGFSDSIRLGEMRRMVESDRVVLRVEGGRADYLRGVVFDRYSTPDGLWEYSDAASAIDVAVARGRPEGKPVIEVRRVAGKAERMFLPLEAGALGTRTGTLRLEATGAALKTTTDSGLVVSYVPGPRVEPISGPGDPEMVIPQRVRPRFRQLAEEWTAGVVGPAERMDAIAARLGRDYGYALTHKVSKGVDPILDFLTTNRSGHCEYFAAALALLGRGAGVPTRVVAGYRVAEHAPARDYWIVREKNAHAWVEAWIPGRGWVTYDATPAAALPQNLEHQGSWTRVGVDAVSDAYDAVREFLVARTATQLWGGAFAAVVALTVFQMWRGARGRIVTGGRAAERTPPHLVRLLKAVSRGGGRPREPWEPLESYARTLAPESRFARAAELLDAWAAHRYGGEGDADTLTRSMEQEAEALRRAGRPQRTSST